MSELKEIRTDIKTLLTETTKNNQEMKNIKEQFVKLNGSVAKHSDQIGGIKEVIKYNKGIVIGISFIISAFWTIITFIA